VLQDNKAAIALYKSVGFRPYSIELEFPVRKGVRRTRKESHPPEEYHDAS